MSTNGKASTSHVFELYAKKDAKLTLRKLDKTTILVEGDSTALEFLGELLLACARSDEHSIQMSPNGAGKNRFTKESTLGFYVHRVPCTEGKSSRRRGGLRTARPHR
jgi:hypothetical protein